MKCRNKLELFPLELGRNHFKFPRKSIAIGCGITRAWRQQEVEGDTEEEEIIKMEKSMKGRGPRSDINFSSLQIFLPLVCFFQG
jgi:hypothetical protein